MVIFPYGGLCFKLRGKRTSVLINPYKKTAGGRLMSRARAEIVTISSFRYCSLERITGSPFVIQGPGEYEIKGVDIIGIPLGQTTAYLYEIDGFKICYLGDFVGELTEKQIEELGSVDILFLLANEKAVSIIDQLEPKVVIPMKATARFFREIGQKEAKPLTKLTMSSSSLPEEREVVWLKR